MMKALLTGLGMGVATLGLLASGAGCAADATGTADESVGSSQEALTSQDFSDPAGLVHIRVKTCDWIGPGPHPGATCSVDAGFVLVGGGAEVEGAFSGGGLLTQSFPVDKTIWQAASTDHVVAFSHRVRAYAVGMALSGMSAATLSSLVTLSQATGAASHAPSATTPQIPAGHVLLSGGARSNAIGAGQLLTGSFPNAPAGFNIGWTASAKDHQLSDVASVTAFALSVPVCLNNQWVAQKCLNVISPMTSVSSGSGYIGVTANTPADFLPLGVGGRARYNGAGRMLTDLFPTNTAGQSGATVFSKDHNVADGGFTDLWPISIQPI